MPTKFIGKRYHQFSKKNKRELISNAEVVVDNAVYSFNPIQGRSIVSETVRTVCKTKKKYLIDEPFFPQNFFDTLIQANVVGISQKVYSNS